MTNSNEINAIEILENNFYEVVDLAVNEWVDGWDSVVFYNPNTNEFESYCWSHNSYVGPDSDLIEVYRIEGNWLACGNWEVNDWLDDNEWEDLQEIKKGACFYSPADLDLIGVSFSSRMYDILSFSKDEIIEDMRRSAESM